jgi:lipopolysaccharide transport periplasmic protein LptA
MTVYTAGHEIKKVVVEGTPATYKQRPDDQDEDIRAQAPRMEYHADDEQINLLHGAKLIQGMNEFSGARIDYDIRQDLVRARGEPSGTQRIEIVIHPKKNSSSKKQGAQ